MDTNSTLTGREHPGTSFAAAERILGRTGSARRRVLEALALLARTDEELQTDLRMPANTQRPRRVELAAAGYIRDSQQRRATASGAKSIVWEATEAGLDMLAVTRRRERLMQQ
jgi:hypothetical protein